MAAKLVDLLFAIDRLPAQGLGKDRKPLVLDGDKVWLNGFAIGFREYGLGES